jgi:hypothetical protein
VLRRAQGKPTRRAGLGLFLKPVIAPDWILAKQQTHSSEEFTEFSLASPGIAKASTTAGQLRCTGLSSDSH